MICGTFFCAPAVRAAEPALAVKQRIDEALRLYGEKNFAAAAAAIEAAFALQPRSDLLYMWAQARRLAGDCVGAIEIYRRFLASAPAESEADKARKNIARCAELSKPPAERADEKAIPTAGPSGTAAVGPSSVPGGESGGHQSVPQASPRIVASQGVLPPPRVVEVAPSRPWFADKGAHVLALGGLVAGAGATGFYLSARSAKDDAAGAGTYSEAVSGGNRISERQTVAVLATGVAAGLLIAAIIKYAVH